SMAAARSNDAGTTRAFLAAADHAASQLGADANHLWTAFGPTNVAIRPLPLSHWRDIEVPADDDLTWAPRHGSAPTADADAASSSTRNRGMTVRSPVRELLSWQLKRLRAARLYSKRVACCSDLGG
ncbi:hypothetical protein ACFSX1_19960, partial [Micromonospora eburnea]